MAETSGSVSYHPTRNQVRSHFEWNTSTDTLDAYWDNGRLQIPSWLHLMCHIIAIVIKILGISLHFHLEPKDAKNGGHRAILGTGVTLTISTIIRYLLVFFFSSFPNKHLIWEHIVRCV